MRSQDKGNRFVVVDKQTDIVKTNHQIERSSFVKPNYPNKEFISNFNSWMTNGFVKNEFQLKGEIKFSIIMLHLGVAPLYVKRIKQVSQFVY